MSPEGSQPPAVPGVFRVTLMLLIAAITAPAHVVEQFYAERHADGIEVLFDAGYAKSGWRGDPDQPPPTLEWLRGRDGAEHADLRRETERYLREHLRFRSDGKSVPTDYRFPDFETEPPTFTRLLTGGAYYRVRIEPRSLGGVTLAVEGEFPDLVLATGGEKKNGSRYLTLESGASIALFEEPDEALPPLVHAFFEGILHVVPEGLDHILFILGIFLLCRRWKPLLWQSLAFTAAHTLTLGLTAAGVIAPSPKWVEAFIALSIAALAVENLCTREFRPWRLALVFGFGLIHGMGFARALAPVLGSGEDFLPRLVATNLGVEAAQVLILSAAWLATWWHASPRYAGFRLVANAMLTTVALYWFVQRIT